MMEGVLSPRESGLFIAENSRDVFLVEEGIQHLGQILVDEIQKGKLDVTMWRQHELNPQSMDEDAVNWVFVSAVLNFSFWSEKDDEKFMVSYKGKEHTGYWSLCAALNRALDEGVSITTPSFYATVDLETLQHVFRSDSNFAIPLLEDRLRVLNEAGKMLVEKFNGSFGTVIKDAQHCGETLMSMVLNNFPSFQDTAEYLGKRVGIYKRVQILVADIWGCCEGKGLGEFADIDSITMFADYRIPQALAYFGAIRYSEDLMEKLRQGTLLCNGSREEVEIRGVSLWACELVRDRIVKALEGTPFERTSINAVLIDHYLWDKRRDIADEMTDVPFHRCRSIYY